MPPSWREQYDRVKRWHVRISESALFDDHHLDDVNAFFIFCYHLKDWLKKDRALDRAIGNAAESLVSSDDWLKLCADVANGAKHLVLDSPRVASGLQVDKMELTTLIDPANAEWEAAREPQVQLVPVIRTVDGQPVAPALHAADECVRAWEAAAPTRVSCGSLD